MGVSSLTIKWVDLASETLKSRSQVQQHFRGPRP